jgi:hypothetical protein
MALSASGAKIVSLVILFVVSLLVSILPLRYHKVVFRSTRTQIGMHFLSCVAGRFSRNVYRCGVTDTSVILIRWHNLWYGPPSPYS